jgi:hypothetical protein
MSATITEVDASHVVMVPQPQAVADVILVAVAGVSEHGYTRSRALVESYLAE